MKTLRLQAILATLLFRASFARLAAEGKQENNSIIKEEYPTNKEGEEPSTKEPSTKEPEDDNIIRIKNPPTKEIEFDMYKNWKGSFDNIWVVPDRFHAFEIGGKVLDIPPYLGKMRISSDRTMLRNVLGCLVITGDNVVVDCNGHKIVHVTITLPDLEDCSCGITIDSKTNVEIQNCHVSGFEVGVCILDSTNIRAYRTTADNNDQGFNVHDSDNVSVEYSVAMNSSQEGFEIRRSTNSFFHQNTAYLNGRDGFDENDGSNSYYLRNRAISNAFNGFELDNHSNVKYSENTVMANGQHGISLDYVDGSLMHDNYILANGVDGLRLDDDTSNFEVSDNYSASNGDDAAMQCSSGCDNNVFTNNLFVGNVNNIDAW